MSTPSPMDRNFQVIQDPSGLNVVIAEFEFYWDAERFAEAQEKLFRAVEFEARAL